MENETTIRNDPARKISIDGETLRERGVPTFKESSEAYLGDLVAMTEMIERGATLEEVAKAFPFYSGNQIIALAGRWDE
jgi:hypothetical protein